MSKHWRKRDSETTWVVSLSCAFVGATVASDTGSSSPSSRWPEGPFSWIILCERWLVVWKEVGAMLMRKVGAGEKKNTVTETHATETQIWHLSGGGFFSNRIASFHLAGLGGGWGLDLIRVGLAGGKAWSAERGSVTDWKLMEVSVWTCIRQERVSPCERSAGDQTLSALCPNTSGSEWLHCFTKLQTDHRCGHDPSLIPTRLASVEQPHWCSHPCFRFISMKRREGSCVSCNKSRYQ